MRNGKVLWITRTAVFIALLIVWQFATSFLKNTMITGSGVNLLLILSVMTGGWASGAAVAVCSPVFAKFFAIGPFWSLIPFVALGNLALVTVWRLMGKVKMGKVKAREDRIRCVAAVALAAVAKFLVLYVGVVRIAVPFLLGLPEKQAAVVSAMFSFPQFLTAWIGGILAALILPVLTRAAET